MTFAFVICGALRLARFNVQALKPTDATSKRYFVGLPIPAGAGLIASIVHFWKTPIATVGPSLLWCLLIGFTAFLMISTVRYQNFKELGIFSRRPRVALVATAMMIALIFRYSEVMLLLLAVTYVASGPRLEIALRLCADFLFTLADRRSRSPLEVTRREPWMVRQAPNVAIVGSSSPMGKNCETSLRSPGFRPANSSLLETEEYAGLLQEFAGEIRIAQIISPEPRRHRYRVLCLQPGNH